MSIFNIDGKFYSVMLKISDLIILNCLFIIMSIPLITIGANMTALYYVSFKIVREEEYSLFKDYWKSFKGNFKQATILWSLILIVGFSLIFYVQYFDVLANMNFLLKLFFSILLCIYLIYFVYVFPLLSRFEFKIKDLLYSLPIIAIRYLFCTLIVTLIIIAPLIIFTLWLPKYFTTYLLILAVGGISGTVALNASFFSKAFDNLMIMTSENA